MDCFRPSQSQLKVTIGSALIQQAAAGGATLRNEINNNIFQDDAGGWQMAVTYYVSNSHHPNVANWTVILHAHAISAPGNAESFEANAVLVEQPPAETAGLSPDQRLRRLLAVTRGAVAIRRSTASSSAFCGTARSAKPTR